MTPDEMVRKIHTLEGAVRWLGDENEKLKAALSLTGGRTGLLERKFHILLTQQNQLLGAIRGLEVGGAAGV